MARREPAAEASSSWAPARTTEAAAGGRCCWTVALAWCGIAGWASLLLDYCCYGCWRWRRRSHPACCLLHTGGLGPLLASSPLVAPDLAGPTCTVPSATPSPSHTHTLSLPQGRKEGRKQAGDGMVCWWSPEGGKEREAERNQTKQGTLPGGACYLYHLNSLIHTHSLSSSPSTPIMYHMA